ncbi:MAG: AmmeMemoRadiSam system radical SAM enzyme [Candidatus Woesearchaeota archaeon]
MKLIKKYFKSLDDKKVICNLCPNNCLIINRKYGLCNARINIDGELYSAVYGYPCSINVDPIEKKPLYHYYPGNKILSIGTNGCNLFCKGCQNSEISRAKPTDGRLENNEEKYYSPQDIIDIALKNNIKLIAYTYNEPTIFFEYMIDIAKIAKKHNIKNVLVSNGYINDKPLKELCKYIDAANIDIKGINNQFYKDYCRANINPILKTIKTLHKKKIWIELTNLIIPGLNDSNDDINQLCKWIKENVGTAVPLHFSKFYPQYKATDINPTNAKTLFDAKKIAEYNNIEYVYLGNLGSIDNTYCSKCKQIVITRTANNHNNISIQHSNMKIIKKKNKDQVICGNCSTILPLRFE